MGNICKKLSTQNQFINYIFHIVNGPEGEIMPPPLWDFVDPHIFVVWTLVFKNLVVVRKIDAG